MRVLALIFDGFEELEAMAPFALLRRAGIDLTIASKRSDVIGAHYIHLKDMYLLMDIQKEDYDVLLLPGGPHYRYMETNEEVLNIIHYFMKENKLVCAICASPTVLGRLGYLKGKNYTCFTAMNDDFGGTYVDQKVVVDGKLITARSADASIDFAYEIIRKVAGEEALRAVWQRIYHEE